MPYKQFQPDVLTASDVQNYLMNQVVMVFDNATDRSTSLTAPTEGMLSYLKDVDKTQVYTGTTWVEVATGSSYSVGLELITTVTVAAGATIAVPSCFNSRFRSYQVVISGVVSGSGDTDVILRFRNGATVETSAVYYDSRIVLAWTSSTVSYGYNNGGTSQNTGMVANATNPSSANLFIDCPFLTTRTTFFAGGGDTRASGGSARYSAGFCNTATSYDGFNLTLASGSSFTAAGFVSVYGQRN